MGLKIENFTDDESNSRLSTEFELLQRILDHRADRATILPSKPVYLSQYAAAGTLAKATSLSKKSARSSRKTFSVRPCRTTEPFQKSSSLGFPSAIHILIVLAIGLPAWTARAAAGLRSIGPLRALASEPGAASPAPLNHASKRRAFVPGSRPHAAAFDGIRTGGQGLDTWRLQHFLGHASMTNTARYTAMSREPFRTFGADFGGWRGCLARWLFARTTTGIGVNRCQFKRCPGPYAYQSRLASCRRWKVFYGTR
jgi:hypothetical protein